MGPCTIVGLFSFVVLWVSKHAICALINKSYTHDVGSYILFPDRRSILLQYQHIACRLSEHGWAYGHLGCFCSRGVVANLFFSLPSIHGRRGRFRLRLPDMMGWNSEAKVKFWLGGLFVSLGIIIQLTGAYMDGVWIWIGDTTGLLDWNGMEIFIGCLLLTYLHLLLLR